MTPTEKDNERRGRVSRILALGLIWAVGVLALVVHHQPPDRRVPAAAVVAR